jgi:hypothetical protein
MHKKRFDEGNRKKGSSSSLCYKIRALESIGFEWAQPKGEAAWMRRYQELVEYKNQTGDCEVPTKYASNKALGRWVSSQRAEYKLWRMMNQHHHDSSTKAQPAASKLLTPERVSMLDALGFRW